jgi:hypothetical protein
VIPLDVAQGLESEDPEESFQVLAFDPGGTTGWSLLAVHPEAMGGDPEVHVIGKHGNVLWWTAGQITGRRNSQVDEMLSICMAFPSARIVSESFRARGANVILLSAEINAILSYQLERQQREVVTQTPAEAMQFCTDDRQKAWGFWIPGQEHARDATKHGLLYLAREKARAVKAASA